MRLLVIGGGGFSKEVADLARACGHEVAAFLEDRRTGHHVPTGRPLVSSAATIPFDAVICAIGDVGLRDAAYARHSPKNPFAVLVHPSACVSEYAELDSGTLVMQNVVVNADANVGVNVILNVGSVVAHDCVVGAHSHIGPGVQLGGGSKVGTRTFLGTGSIILPGVRVGSDCTVGAGAVVNKDVASGSRVAGVPARLLPRSL